MSDEVYPPSNPTTRTSPPVATLRNEKSTPLNTPQVVDFDPMSAIPPGVRWSRCSKSPNTWVQTAGVKPVPTPACGASALTTIGDAVRGGRAGAGADDERSVRAGSGRHSPRTLAKLAGQA